MTDKVLNDFIEKKLDSIKKYYSPRELWFFGSRAAGNSKKQSDIDLIIVSDKFGGTKFIYRMGDFLKKIDYPVHIDAICYTPEEFSKKLKEIGIIRDAVKSGIKII